MKYSIPNLLTLLRIVLIPFLVIVYLLPVSWANDGATLIFTIAAFTDWLDGYLARKWNQTSSFGEFLDPVADKLMIATALVLLINDNPTPFAGFLLAIPAGVIIGREIAISALREWMAEIGERTQVAVSVIGKIKTSVQMLAIILLLFREPIGAFPTVEVGLVLLYIAAALTLWSMVIYIKAAWPFITSSTDSNTEK
jgi:CDP-diacylglycerol--glycerol-3-phosphate 3-phosphatidyltransferase/cardiolipin synthase